MKYNFAKTRIVCVVRLLLLLTAVLACTMVAKVSAFMAEADTIPKRIEKALSQDSDDGEKLKELKLPYTEVAKELKKKNIFSPTPEKKNPVSKIDAVFGKEALINGKWYKAGDKIEDAQIISVAARSVMVRWNDKDKAISPFDHTAKIPEKKSKPKKKSKASQVVVEAEPRSRQRPEGGSGSSEEERRRRRAERRGKKQSKKQEQGEGQGGK